VKWVGLQILDAFDSLEICRRRWVIRRFLKQIEGVAPDKRGAWLALKQHKVDRATEDLLELTLYVLRALHF
jgi:hypothetical protein